MEEIFNHLGGDTVTDPAPETNAILANLFSFFIELFSFFRNIFKRLGEMTTTAGGAEGE